MRVTILESEGYQHRAADPLTAGEREALRAFLAENPEIGDVIPGLQGLRKLRWTQQCRNQGKRGGTRIIYFYAGSRSTIVLLYVFSKREKEDLTNADRKNLKAAAKELKDAIAASQDDAPRR